MQQTNNRQHAALAVTNLRFGAMTIRVPIILLLSLAATTFRSEVRGPSGAVIPESFAALSPTKGLWRGWPVGTTVTTRQTFTDQQFNMHSVQFGRLILVGRADDGTAVVAGYSAELEAGPWKFTQTAFSESRRFRLCKKHGRTARPSAVLSIGTIHRSFRDGSFASRAGLNQTNNNRRAVKMMSLLSGPMGSFCLAM